MNERLTVGLLALGVVAGVGGALLAVGVGTPIDDTEQPAPSPGAAVEASSNTGDPARSARDLRDAGDDEGGHGEDAGRAGPRTDDLLEPTQVERNRVGITWDDARAVLLSGDAWSGADDALREKVAHRIASRLPGVTHQGFETFEGAGRRHRLGVFRHQRTGLELVLVPGGTFTMGSPSGEPGRDPHETQHEVTLSPFLISRTEATQAAWLAVYRYDEFMPAKWRGANLPLESISRKQAMKFCERAGGRLPTEAEWEYACRAGGADRFWFGDDERELGVHAWVKQNSGLHTHPVAQLPPNPFGLFDMHGNVWEWVSDGHAAYPSEPVTDPTGPKRGFPVIRGGSWWDTPKDVRSAKRLAWNNAQHNVGFRMAMSVD